MTQLILRQSHLDAEHAGVQLTLNVLRQEFWVIHGRNLVKSLIHKCVICKRVRAQLSSQYMSSLPTDRCNPARAFSSTGVDFAGPFLIHDRIKRRAVPHKYYVSVFICLATRAMHLELVNSLEAQSFIDAFDRFVSRRGKPRIMFSNNGRNFVGANAELKRRFAEATENEAFLNFFKCTMYRMEFHSPFKSAFRRFMGSGG